MKVSAIVSALALIAPAVLAKSSDSKQVIVSYPNDVADSVVAQAKEMIHEAGGFITHEFTLIKGFVAKADADILASIQAMDAHDRVVIEEDQTVSTS